MNTVKSEQGFAVWITGLPASGKSTLTRALVAQLGRRGVDAAVLESDSLRRALSMEQDYDRSGRRAFYDAMLWIGQLLISHGVGVIFDATASKREFRDRARRSFERYAEVYVACPLQVCVDRDPKGIYKQGLEGKTGSVPGLGSEYEVPLNPEVTVSGDSESVEVAVERVLRIMVDKGYVGA
jgi:adenylylsulfate kinase